MKNDIKMQAYNTKMYPPTNEFFHKLEEDIPESLKLFIDIISHKRVIDEKWQKRRISICHAIIKACRPRSYMSALQVRLVFYITFLIYKRKSFFILTKINLIVKLINYL